MALIELEPHPLEKQYDFIRPLRELDLVPQFALEVVAARIDAMRKSKELKYRPRLSEIRAMALRAMQAGERFQSQVDAIFRSK
jgi:hypothetical protein